MKTIEINGKKVKTNYHNKSYSVSSSERTSMIYEKAEWVLDEGAKYKRLETTYEMLERLANEGYTTITFYNEPTSIRGCYETYAWCK